jgi:glyoxylase-like metal-dependent hydrolase (beta-lactamase superfamily II)
MFRSIFRPIASRLLVAVVITASMHAAVAADAVAAQLQLSIIKTAEAHTLEALTYSGGGYTKRVKLQHIAVLVRHPQGTVLFDTGLGRQVDAQVKADMPLWARPLFAAFGPVLAARSQLDAAGVPPIGRIVLSHVHWDHASGLVDFPEAQVWLPQQERDFMAHPNYLAVFPSQVSAPTIQWKPFQWENKPYEGFAQSLDLFGDASVVLVPLPGHTPGSTGMYVSLRSGKKFLFVGDAVWRADAIAPKRPKMWISSMVVDSDAAQTLKAVATLADLQAATPGLVIVPAHDADVHDAMDAYFPKSVQ